MNYDLLKIASQILFDAHSDISGARLSKRKEREALTDDELIKIAQSELPYQTGAFEILINRYRQKVFGKLISMLKNREEAFDVLQDVFVKVFNGLPRFKGNSSFSTWLYTITVNTALNHIEKMQRRPWWWISEDIGDVKESQREDESLFRQVDESLEREEMRAAIQNAMNSMSENAREIIHLRYFEELDYKTISDRLGIGLSATKMRLKRAREEFKECFTAREERDNYERREEN